MTPAIVIIAFTAYLGFLVQATLALRHKLAAAAIVAFAVGTELVLHLQGPDLLAFSMRFHEVLGDVAQMATCAAMFGVGVLVPTALVRTARRRTFPRGLTLFLAFLITAFAVDLWWAVLRLSFAAWFASPELWFAAGVATFLVVTARFFEDSEDAGPRRAA